MNHNVLRFIFIVILSNINNPPGICQSEIPDVLKTGNLTEQLNYIEERTRIYDYYRAIREDMWQQIKKNTLDTIATAKGEISTLTLSKNKYDSRIDSLNKLVTDAKLRLEEAVRTKNSISVLGLEVNKFAYNSVMLIIVAGLAILLAIGFLAFKRNILVTRNIKMDLEELKAEFESYRKQSREAREKMSMEHFNELRRLRARGEEHRAEDGGQRAEGSGLKAESLKPSEKDEVASVQDPELNVREEIPINQTPPGSQTSGITAETQDKVPGIKNESRKPRKKKTQSPGQGSIEL